MTKAAFAIAPHITDSVLEHDLLSQKAAIVEQHATWRIVKRNAYFLIQVRRAIWQVETGWTPEMSHQGAVAYYTLPDARSSRKAEERHFEAAPF